MPGEHVTVADIVDEVARGGEDVLGAPRHFAPGFSQCDLARPPFHQFRADLALEFAHLHRQRRLGHRAFVRRPAEMAVAGERCQIAQLTKGDHRL